MWSLRSSIDDTFDTFLVVSVTSETRILAMNLEGELEETEIGGFCSQVQTLFCHDAMHNQLVQVTSSSVRLVSSNTRELKNEWHSRQGCPISVATANATQVLLVTGRGILVYLDIGDGMLNEIKQIKLEFDISCLDINPIGENLHYSQLAAVGMWKDVSVRIFSLPDLNPMKKVDLGEEIMPRSVLLCAFEGISYLLCALGDGHLLNFRLNMHSGELTDKRKVSLGTQPITLRIFASENTTRVFAATDRPTVIFSSNKKLLYSNVNLKEVSHVCQFRSAASPDSLAIAKEGELAIGIIDDTPNLHIRSIPLKEQPRCICHQKQSRTFGICSWSIPTFGGYYPEHSVRLLDDQTFELKSTYPLHQFEHGFSIVSCSFSDDSNVYYCVGTGYHFPKEKVSLKGRILVFTVEEGKLQLIAEKETKGTVYCLNAFNGKLLAAIDANIQLYKWTLRDGGSGELQSECQHVDCQGVAAFYVKTYGYFIVVGDLMKPFISLLIYKHEEGAIEELARHQIANYLSAIELLHDGTYLGAGNKFNLFRARKNSRGATDEERGCFEVVGEYHLGELVNQFRHGSLGMPLEDSNASQIPTTIFSTLNGAIGVIAPLSHGQYLLLEKLQSNLRWEIEVVGLRGLSHEEWRSFHTEGTLDARNFLDGDLIESFLKLSYERMGKISTSIGVSVEEIREKVEEMTRLH